MGTPFVWHWTIRIKLVYLIMARFEWICLPKCRRIYTQIDRLRSGARVFVVLCLLSMFVVATWLDWSEREVLIESDTQISPPRLNWVALRCFPSFVFGRCLEEINRLTPQSTSGLNWVTLAEPGVGGESHSLGQSAAESTETVIVPLLMECLVMGDGIAGVILLICVS